MKQQQNQTTILLIESNSDWLTNVYSVLQEAGYNVLTATGGDKGFCAARRERPDLIVCEAALPDISGIHLCYMIRADKNLQDARFIMMGDTTGQNCKSAFDSYEAGADDFFDKNCNPQYLAAKIGRLLALQRAELDLRQDFENLHRSNSRLAEMIEDLSDFTVALTPRRELAVYKDSDFSESGKTLNIEPTKTLARRIAGVLAALKAEKSANSYQFENENQEKFYYEIIS